MTARTVRSRVRDSVGMISIDRPPANALDPGLCAALAEVLDRFLDEPSVRAVVLTAAGPVFSRGTDLDALDRPEGSGPSLADLCARIEGADRPVIAALPGPALGAGAELALAAHVRLAAPGARIGFPEIALDLLPEAGATQRLPRLVGPRMALAMLLGGRPVPAGEAQRAGLIDGIVTGDVASGAFAYASRLLAEGRLPVPARDRRGRLADGIAYMAEVRRRRDSLPATARLAALRMIDCVEATLLLPFEAGLAFEAEARRDCLAQPVAVALRHLARAERRIGPALVTREAEGRHRLTEAGTAAVERLRTALARAAAVLVRQGATETEVDAALVAAGWPAGPFGATPGGPAGPQAAGIVARCHAALVAEGARLVEMGLVARPADVDVLAVHALGFPRLSGGPMRAAQTAGLPALRKTLVAWTADDRVWALPPLVAEAARLAGWFDALTPASAEDDPDHHQDQPEEG